MPSDPLTGPGKDGPVMPDRQRVCIIGAGLTGLVAASALQSAGYDVVLIESTRSPGGMIASFPVGSERIEYIYHHIFTHDKLLVRLLDTLGLSDRLKWFKPSDALVADGTLHPFSSPLDLLRFPVIPFGQRLRTGLAVLRAARLKDWKKLEDETAAQWLIRNCGSDAYRRLWQPLLRAKFDNDADTVSAVWIWNKFKLRGHSRSHETGAEMLGYLDGSFGLMVDELVRRITARGSQILTGHTAMNISQVSDTPRRFAVSCILENCATVQVEANAVVATVSSRQFAGMTTSYDWPDTYLRQVNRLSYKGDLCLVLRLRRSLSPYYWTTICDSLPFVVVVEHTNLVGPRGYGGHIIYLSRYLDISDPVWTQSDGEIYRLFIQGLSRLYPHFSAADVIDWRLQRTRCAQPVIGRGYSRQMPAMDTPWSGVKLAGMAQIYPEDRGMNYAVRLGLDAARSVLREDQLRGAADPGLRCGFLQEEGP